MAQPIWVTAAGSIGSYPAQVSLSVQLVAQPVSPATSITYILLSGLLPTGLSLSSTGVILGTPIIVTSDTSYTFVVRATDNLGNIRDRTFFMIVSGVASPEFTTPSGSILTTLDSTWVELPIEYSNPLANNEVSIRVIQGQLPPGLEINSNGLIRGYAEPPVLSVNLGTINTSITSVNSNVISSLSTTGFRIGRPIIFNGTGFSGINPGQTYYVSSIIDESSFTISLSVGGVNVVLSNGVGYMTAILPNIAIGQPTVQTYSFTLKLESLLGTDLESYSIVVQNQNSPEAEGGAKPANSRVPTIYNTRPPTYDITESTPYFGYYVLPPDSGGFTYSPTEKAFIGKIASDNQFSFKAIGKDFDDNLLVYSFADLPLGLTGDSNTGWVTGNPVIADDSISQFSFSVAAYKASNPTITTPNFNFSFIITNDIDGDIVWITPSNLGVIENSSISTLSVVAESDVELEYRLVSGSLPPNLTLLSNGDISGTVAYQPINVLLNKNDETTFTFTVQAFAPSFSTVVQSTRTFTVTVTQEYVQPTDTLYIKCAPSIQDRNLLRTLLDNEELIPSEYLYRPDDPNFGKADNVTYVHAYGIFANDLDAYVAAVTKNHYWRNITLGEIKTAVAKNNQGEVIYEVVYSSVIDNLVNPEGVSVSKEIFWPRFIDLNLGPWYTSVTNLYTSYIGASQQGDLFLTEINDYITTEDLFIIETESGQPAYYTGLTPGYARTLYPNSLPNMRQQVGDVLGQEFNFRLYPSWMTSQQANGSTLGFTPAWVIAYCKPGILVTTDTVVSGSFTIGQMYTIKSIGNTDFTEIGAASNTVGLTFTATNLGIGTGTAYLTTGMTYDAFNSTGLNRSSYKSYAEQLQFNIQYGWKNPATKDVITLNQINFKIDRFAVDKSLTYNYDSNLSPTTWTGLPSGTPVPDPKDSKDFFVLFPRETILPDETQY